MKTIYSLAMSMLLIVCANAQVLDKSNPRLLFSDHAEQLTCVNYNNLSSPYAGYWTYTGGTQNTCSQSNDNNVTISNKYSRAGSTSYRHYVKYTGNNDGQWGRGEWGVLNPGTQTIDNQWRWAAISILIDPNHAFESRRYQIAFDHKESPDDQETPFYLAILGTRYVLYGRFVDDPYVDLGPVETGVWVDWLLERNWSTNSDGYLRFYKNGQLMWERNGSNRDGRSGSAAICRVQHGFYKWAWYSGNPEGSGSGNTTGDLIMYSDEIKFGGVNATFADMQPGNGTAPAPAPNSSPTAQSGSNQTITLPASTVTLNGSGADSDGSISSYAWTKVGGPSGGTIQSPNNASTQITGLEAGNYTFQLTVTDNNGAKGTDDVQITVLAAPVANASPTVQSGANETITLPVNSVSLQGTASDPDGTIADYTWTKVSGPAGGAIQDADAVSTQITGLQEGTYVYRLTVTDDDGATAQDDLQITVIAAPVPNAVPTIQSGTNVTITLPVNNVTLNGTAADSDGTIADYTWTKVSGPSGGAIATPDAASTQITGLTEGTYVYRLTVTDDDGANAQDEVTITVNAAAPPPAPNAAPSVQSGANATITLPVNSVTLTGTATDTDGTIADYTWTKVSGPTGGTIATADAASTQVTGLTEGTYVYRLTVTDNDGATAQDEVTITVNAAAPAPVPNAAPTVQSGSNVSITLPVNNVTLTGTATDTDGTISDYTWTKLSGPTGGAIATADASSTQITGLTEGTYVYRLTVTDNDGATAQDEVTITVDAAIPAPVPNAAPTVQSGSNVSITLPVNNVTLTGTATDADGTIADYTWTKVSGPTDGTIATADAASTQVTGLTEGTYVYRLTVTDNDGATAQDEVTITVNAAAPAPAPAPNAAPTVQSGSNASITLPVNNVTLTGTATDADGTIADYTWTKVSGPAGGALATADAASTQITGLTEGTYVYRLTVTDNDGATAQDEVTITVNAAAPAPAPASNAAPTVQSGSNVSITLPVNSVTLTGTATDADGTIADYTWTKVSGPTGGNIATPDAAGTQITGLTEGTYVYRLTVTDNDGATAQDEVTITVDAAVPAPAPNAAPTVQSGTNATITLPVNSVTLTGTANDADGTIADYTWTKLSGPTGGAIATPDAASTQITGLTEGTYVYRLTVTDNDGATAQDEVTITVDAAVPAPAPAPAPNAAPTVQSGSNVSITLPVNNVTLTGTATDADGTIADYTWTKLSGPTGGAIATADAAGTQITGLTEGTYVFRLTVTDNDGATAQDEITIVVNAAAPAPSPNAEPSARAGSNLTITLPSNSVTLNGTGNDPDGSISDYTWTKVSGPGGGSITDADAATTQITGLQAGTYVYRLTVTDDDGATAQDDITITVNDAAAPPPAPNVEPAANAGTNKSITLPVNTVTLNGGGTDTDGTIADYTWTKVSGPAGGAIGNADASSTDVTGLREGTYVYRLTVTDNDGATATDDVQVTVNAGAAAPPNAAPVSTAGTNQVITLPGNTVTLNGSGTDSDGTIADYTWTKVSGPSGGTIGTADAASTGISGLTAGTYVFRLTVTDNDGGTDSDDVIVVVNPEPTQAANQPPSAAAGGDITIRLPISAVTLNGSGADADGQIASYRWTKVSGPASGNFQAAGQQSTGYNGLSAGVYVVRLTVTDDDGATAFDEVQITVRAAASSPQPPANEAPSANAGADIRITLPVNTATLNGVGTDVDGTIASYNWTKVSGPSAGTIVNPAAQSTGVTNLVEGVYEFRLTISDNSGAKSSDDVRVTVRKAANVPANQAPSATAGSDRVILLPVSTVNLRGNAADADGSVVSYNWKKMSGPSAGTIQAESSQGTSVVDLKEGEYVFRFTAKDDKGASGSDELKVTVKAAAAPLPNQLPVADAGTDITVIFPVTGATLNGSNSSDPDGTIASYRWVMVKGPVTGTLSNGNSPAATLTDLVEGVYEFELTVFDNDGASSVDRVLVTVTGNNTRPVVIVSDTMTVYLPAQNTQLDASQSYDTDGTIRSYEWTRVSGPGNPGLLSPSAGKTIVTDLVSGTYRFSITITDNDGSVSKAFVTVLVKNSTARRLIPVVNLYPNPAETNVTLTIDSEVSGKAELVVYDMLGRAVMRESFNKTSRTIQRRLNITTLADGMYAIELSIDQAEKVVRKIVKQ